jgi:hypothetical protein
MRGKEVNASPDPSAYPILLLLPADPKVQLTLRHTLLIEVYKETSNEHGAR